ncbi:ATP-binding protein [Thermococcus waiotapuensis]|uniref:ATP-binding protein n=1 Tax=Thermococcus waiotapuensis TaxID=90909 RepID=A0AAE4T499_9EURY|nr:ATP-binding protein [Thermococcus waiotapuensis]MDV3104678.1 ATP-binding protein [Thermococcus waiotapuensis]
MRFGPFEVWDDVLDETLDMQVAPELGDVVSGNAHRVYTDSKEFFRRTYFTDAMLDVLDKIIRTLEGRERHNIFLIYSLFGGGKTHTLLTVYHAFRDPEAMLDPEVLAGHDPEKREKIKNLAERIKALGGVKIVTVYGKGRLGQPSKPLEVGPYSVKTVWGYIAHSLGKYSIVEKNDENATVPDVDTLRKLFDRKVVLLVDEVVDYFDNLYNSGNEDDRRYANNVDNFFDRLATALLGSSSAMVMTLPMEKKEGVFEVEKEYNREVVMAIWSAVSRVGGSELYSPMRTSGAGNELVEVLKKRIFRGIDDGERIKTLTRMHSELSNKEIFGDAHNLEDELRRSYPFHPEYVDILRTIIERAGLQRTRDMLRITRIVMREIVDRYKKTGFVPSMVMPHHIDLRNEKLRGLLFGKSETFMDYATIVDTDIEGSKFKDFSKPGLAEIVLKYVFLKTYSFDSPVPLPGFPTPDSIARGVYELNEFDANGWLPTDIKDTVDEIMSSVRFVYLNKKDRVLWFWRIANVAQMVESRARELLEMRFGEVWNELVEHVNKIVRERKSITTTRGRGAKIEDHVTFFREQYIVVAKEPEEFNDTPDYKLHVLVRDDVDERTLRKLIYAYGTGTRTYRNTVVVCYPVEGSFRHLLETTARIMACNEVIRDINVKYGQFGEEVVKIQTNMVKDIEGKAREDLEAQIVNSFRQVAYPENDDVRITRAQSSSKSVVENVYSTLLSKGKIVNEFDFEWLVDTLRDVGVEVLRPEGYRVSELIAIIRTNTRLPMIEDSHISGAIKNAIRDLKIGLERDGEVFFKKVDNEVPTSEEEGNPPNAVEPSDIILPRETALHRQVCSLLKNEKDLIVPREDKDFRVKTWYEVYSLSSEIGIPLKSIVTGGNDCRVKDEYFDMVLWGHIVERREETPVTEGEFELEIGVPQVKEKPGKPVQLEVTVVPLGRDSFTVELSVTRGELDSDEVKLEGGKPAKVTWTIIMPETKTTATIEGRSPKRTRYLDVGLIPDLGKKIVETDTLKEEHKGMFLTSILGIEDVETLSLVPENVKGTVSGSLRIDRPLWEGRFEGVEKEVLAYLVRETEELLGGKANLEADLSLSEEVVVDDLLFEKLRPLNGKVLFRLRKEEG